MKRDLFLLIVLVLTGCANKKNGVEKHRHS